MVITLQKLQIHPIGRLGQTIGLSAIASLGVLLSATTAHAQNITGANDGVGTVVDQTGQTYDITGGSISGDGANLFHSFQDFNLTTVETANFAIDPTIQNILGRIGGGQASIINGVLQITGGSANLYLINPAGVFFGANAVLNLPASLTVTTADGVGFDQGWFPVGGDADYQALVGTPHSFVFSSIEPGSIINQGELTVGTGQHLRLLGGTVVNTGTLTAPAGEITVVAVAGEQWLRLGVEDSLLSFDLLPLDQATALQAAGTETLTPLSLVSLLSNNPLNHATSLNVDADGNIVLGGATLTVAAGTAIASGELNATNAGQIAVLGDQVALIGAALDVSNHHDGGNIRIGGDFQGQGLVPNAEQTYIDANTVLEASARDSGSGGRVIIWADDTTQFYGNILATAGIEAGDGGFVEVSGHENLIFRGDVDLSSPQGEIGTLLLDPRNIRIISGSGGADDTNLPMIPFGLDPNDRFTISEVALESLGGNADIELQATNNIVIQDLADNALEFAGGTGSITFTADADGDGSGTFRLLDPLNDVILTNGRDLTISAGAPNTGLFSIQVGNIDTDGGDINFQATDGNIIARRVTSRGGDIEVEADVGSITTLEITSSGDAGAGNLTLLARDDISIQRVTANSDSAFEGGSVFIESTMGRIIAQVIETSSTGSTAGNVDLLAQGSITTLDIFSSGAVAGGSVSLQSERGAVNAEIIGTFSDGGRSGDVSIIAERDITTQDIRSNGELEGGDITLQSDGGTVNSGVIQSLSEGDAGDIDIVADGDVLTGEINSSGRDRGGDVHIISVQGQILADGFLNSFSEAGTAGSVSLQATGNIGTSEINSEGRFAGGDIQVTSDIGSITVRGLLDSFSPEGDGGSINLFGRGDILAGDISTFGAQRSGSVQITSTNGSITTLDITTSAIFGASGAVTLFANGDISTGDITTSGLVSGDINITSVNGVVDTGELFTTTGVIEVRDIYGPQGIEFRVTQLDGNSDAAIEALSDLEAQRAQEFSDYFGQDLSAAELTPVEVQQILKDIRTQTGNHTAIVYMSSPQSSTRAGGDPQPLEWLIFTADADPVRITMPLVTAADLEATIADFRNNLFTSLRRRSTSYLEPSQQLYDWLIYPLETVLGPEALDTVLFSMDGGLRSLPLAALHDGEQFLVEKYSLGSVPSISLMSSEYKPLAGGNVLAMGASVFKELAPLPAVPAEVEAITNLWPGESFLNESFTRENLLQQRQQTPYEIIHLATHAEFKSGTAENSYIQLWDDKLRLSELSHLGWDNPTVELLVLSACQTAVGDPNAEMGFAGLSVVSGVRSAVASLWSVSDAGTLALMAEFYDQLTQSPVKAEALRQAQLAMLNGEVRIEQNHLARGIGVQALALPPDVAALNGADLSHPYYWSGFTMIGSPW